MNVFLTRKKYSETIGYAMTHFSGESPNIASGFPRKSRNEIFIFHILFVILS